MKTYKQILLVGAAVGILLTGCANKPEKPNLRQNVYHSIRKLSSESYSVTSGNCIITASIPQRHDLKVKIQNKTTGDILSLTDKEVIKYLMCDNMYYKTGVDIARYNDVYNGTKGMDQRFDQALRILKPQLEQKINSEIHKVKDRTRLWEKQDL